MTGVVDIVTSLSLFLPDFASAGGKQPKPYLLYMRMREAPKPSAIPPPNGGASRAVRPGKRKTTNSLASIVTHSVTLV